MSFKRKTRSELVTWMLTHPEAWEGFPKTNPLPGMKSHWRRIEEAMKADGMFAPATAVSGFTIERLVSLARFARRMEQQQPHPERN